MTDHIMQTNFFATAERPEKLIGAILVESGKLTLEDVEQVLKLQDKEHTRFGEAAISLGLVASEDVQHALAHQYSYPYLLSDAATVSEALIAAYQPYSCQVELLRTLRSQLIHAMETSAAKCKFLSLVSPSRGEGRSVMAANLAIMFAQTGVRTLLIDADMRHPSQHELFNLDNRRGLSSLLAGLASKDQAVQKVTNFPQLSVLTSGPVPPNPQELLSQPMLASFFANISGEFDWVLLDTSAAADFADAQIVALRAGNAVVLARKNHSRLNLVVRQTEGLSRSGVAVLGTVLSEF